MSMVYKLLSEHYACCSGMLQALGGLSAQRGTEDKHRTYCVVTCSSAVSACNIYHPMIYMPLHQSDVVHKCPQLAWYMHGQPRKELVMGSLVPRPHLRERGSGDIRQIPRASLKFITFWREIPLRQSHCRKDNLQCYTGNSWLLQHDDTALFWRVN